MADDDKVEDGQQILRRVNLWVNKGNASSAGQSEDEPDATGFRGRALDFSGHGPIDSDQARVADIRVGSTVASAYRRDHRSGYQGYRLQVFKMVQVRKYQLPPTALIPNSPQPLLHYPGLLTEECQKSPNTAATRIHDLFASNGWETQWIFRYGATQDSHYHSATHECMAVLSGNATIRFGVADTVSDLEESTHGNGKEPGGIELEANAGDVFVLPAGLAHKTYDTYPHQSFVLLTPGTGHGVEATKGSVKDTLADLKLEGFTMIGAYPTGGQWDFALGGEHVGNFEKVWSVPKPEKDPVLGDAAEGVCGLWQ